MTKHHKIPIRESLNRFNRYLEELDSIRDRAIVTQEELLSQLSETLNRRMYILSLVATFFLPMGFLTGLLGINVGGIPGADRPIWFFDDLRRIGHTLHSNAICAEIEEVGSETVVAEISFFLKVVQPENHG